MVGQASSISAPCKQVTRPSRFRLLALLAALLPLVAHGQPLPDPPGGLAARALDGQAVLSWSDPRDWDRSGSAITGYFVRYSTSLPVTSSWTAIAGSGPTTTSHTVTGLTNGTRYYFQIFATNRGGSGTPSTATTLLVASPGTAVTISDANLRARLETLTGKATGETITRLDMAGLPGTLRLSNANISVLTGLERAINVEKLILWFNKITDLTPLGGLTSLAELRLSYNRVSDLTPLSDLTSLTVLDLDRNRISDVTPLAGLASLERLELDRNRVTDIAPLAGLPSLRVLELNENPLLSDLTPLGGGFTALQDLWLARNQLGSTDLTPLAGLTSLQSLYLYRAGISDVTPLAAIASLNHLFLDNNPISDISPLASLPSLHLLSLGHTGISDVTPLGTMASLTFLDLEFNGLTDIAPLGSLTSLFRLELGGNRISDLTPLSGLTSLEWLDLEYNSVSNLTPLAGLTSLWLLDLRNNAIAEVGALRGLTSLGRLYLQNNAISNVAALAANAGIATSHIASVGRDRVNLRGNPLSKESIYAHIPTMRRRGALVFFDAPPNDAPEAVGKLDDAKLAVGSKLAVELADAFRDPNNEALTLFATSSRPAVASANMVGYTLIVRALVEGTARITVTAEDPLGATASLSFLLTVGNPVSLGAAGIDAVASAPEGGSASLAVTMAEPRSEDVSFTYSFGPDADPATADADAADHGGEGGTVTIPAGKTEATFDIPILDDDDIEPVRESFAVTLTSDEAGLGTATATVHIAEGVCDRTWQVADALRGGWDCEAVTAAELGSLRMVRLADAGLNDLQPLDFLGLTGMTTLDLDGNGLSALPDRLLAGSPNLRVLRLRGNSFATLPALGDASALVELDLGDNGLLKLPARPFAGLPALGYLYLDGNRLEALPADLLADASGMRIVELQNNALHALPEGLFAGASLVSLQLQGNPGAPFPVAVELVRAEAEDGDAGWAEIQLRVPHGAPFAISAGISAPGATLSATTAAIAAGDTLGDEQVSVVRSMAGNEAGDAVTVAVASVPSLPRTTCGDDFDEYRCFRGFELTAGDALTLFEPPASGQARSLRMR